MIKLSEMLPPRPEPWWQLLRQCGVENVVALLNGAEQDQRMFASVGGTDFGSASGDDAPWSLPALQHNQETFARAGFTVVAYEDTAPMDCARLGLPGRDEEISQVITQIRAMGQLGIPTLCYNWMAKASWGRTDPAVPSRGGALVSGYNRAVGQARSALVEPGEVTEDQLWSALDYFLAAVVPVAEEAGVQLGLHPDDPPQGWDRNLPRIMSSVAAYQRMLALQPSPANGITLCQGNFSLMPEVVSGEVPLPDLIRKLGGQQIGFVHFRDVRGTVEDFVETFHDDGQTDMPECMRAYADVGFAGPMRPDHVPTMAGESNDHPGYETLGRLFALGYIRGVEQAAFGHPSTRESEGTLP
ncbi:MULTISPECIES: mannonate dehydratase [unclassified Nocardioides]|uniref:mannonate dehydratase n=1 Tax=unclassified Nocardioides TaxID=2615069 RepID=UPI0006FE169B|nr:MULTISPECIES: mannonate dehydratase [unclassified Nocardioides]KRA37682.1 mannonate dehydratase [Nocardioides sp. Root614]KRA91642.1 mannonate dehydratase [Nocardioides sp. Root682]